MRKDIYRIDSRGMCVYMVRFPERKDVAKRLATMENPSDAEVSVVIQEEMDRWRAKLPALNTFLGAEHADRQTSAVEKKAAEEEERLLQQEKERKRLDELEEERKKLEQANRDRAALLQAPQAVPSSGPPSGAAPPALISGPPSGAPPNSGDPSGGGNPPSSAGQLGAWQQTPIPFSQASGGYVRFLLSLLLYHNIKPFTCYLAGTPFRALSWRRWRILCVTESTRS